MINNFRRFYKITIDKLNGGTDMIKELTTQEIHACHGGIHFVERSYSPVNALIMGCDLSIGVAVILIKNLGTDTLPKKILIAASTLIAAGILYKIFNGAKVIVDEDEGLGSYC